MAPKPVSQSRTQWNPAVKNAAGKVVKKGYLSQYGRPEKKVTGKVKLVTETGGKRAGQTQKYSSGRKVVSKSPAFAVGGSNPAVVKKDVTPPPPPPKKTGAYQAGAGTKATAATTTRSAAQAKAYAARQRSASQASKYAKNPYKRRWDDKKKRWVAVSNA